MRKKKSLQTYHRPALELSYQLKHQSLQLDSVDLYLWGWHFGIAGWFIGHLFSSIWNTKNLVHSDCINFERTPTVPLWRNHPKLLGPGALIFIARQLWPNSARTGSSSSEASIKATLFQDRTDNTHTKVSPEITTQNISYISEWLQRKINLLQTEFRIAKYYRVQLFKLFKSQCSTEVVKDN